MGFIRRSNTIILTAALIFTASTIIMAHYTQAIESEEFNSISRSCSTIKQTLSQLQHADLRTRTYLGATYEAIATNFIIPINLRLVKLNQPDPELLAIQADFTEAQAAFRTTYTTYMRDLDNLISIDCSTHPQDFYQQLEIVRAHRSELHDATTHLASLVDRQYQAVTNLMEKLKDEQ